MRSSKKATRKRLILCFSAMTSTPELLMKE
jgi:hypothetical protein